MAATLDEWRRTGSPDTGKISGCNRYNGSAYAKEMEGDWYAGDDCDAVSRVAERTILRLTHR